MERSVEQKDETEANKQQAPSAREYVVKLEDELQKICDDIFELVDKSLAPLASAGQSRTIYCKPEGGVEAVLESAVMSSEKVPDTDRTRVLSILPRVSSDGDRYASQTGEIAGVLKQLKDETTADSNGQKTVVDVPVVLQRQEAMIWEVQKTVEVPQVQRVDEINEVPVVVQCQVLTIRIVKKTAKARQVQFLDRMMDVPVVKQRHEERIVAETIDVPVPRVTENIIEVLKHVPQEQAQSCTVEQIIDLPVPHVKEEIIEVLRRIARERVPKRTVEQTVAVPVPRVMEETIKVAKNGPQERVHDDTVEQLVDVTVPWICRGTGRVSQSILQDRISGCVGEQIVDVVVPEVRAETGQVIQFVSGGNAEHIKKPIANGMLGNVEASKIHAGVDVERARDADADVVGGKVPQEPPQQHRSQPQQRGQKGEKEEKAEKEVRKRKKERKKERRKGS